MKRLCTALVIAISITLYAGTINVSDSTGLADAISNLRPGDTVVLADGIYTNNGSINGINAASNNPVVIKAQNTGGAHWRGYLRVYDSSYVTIDGIVFDLVADRSSSKNIHVKHSEHCRFTRCTFDLDESGLTKADIRYWLSIEAGRYNEIDYCRFDNKITQYPTIKVVYNEFSPHIHHNYFNGRPSAGGLNGYETLQLGSGSAGHKKESMQATVEYNLFESCDGEAEIISVKTSDNCLRFNTFRNCRGQLVLRLADNCQVYNNYFLNPSLKAKVGGVRIHGSFNQIYNNYFERLTDAAIDTKFGDANSTLGAEENTYRQSKENLIAFNTAFDCRDAAIDFQSPVENCILPAKDWRVMNNLFVIRNTALIKGSGDLGTIYENNIAYEIGKSGITNMGRTLTSNQMWVVDNDLKMSPDTVWRQQAASPGIGRATPLPTLNYQFDLDHELRDSTPDIGADEYSSADAKYHPLIPEDVGPGAY